MKRTGVVRSCALLLAGCASCDLGAVRRPISPRAASAPPPVAVDAGPGRARSWLVAASRRRARPSRRWRAQLPPDARRRSLRRPRPAAPPADDPVLTSSTAATRLPADDVPDRPRRRVGRRASAARRASRLVRRCVVDDLAAMRAAWEAAGLDDRDRVGVSVVRRPGRDLRRLGGAHRRRRAAALRTARPGHSEHQLGTAIDVISPGWSGRVRRLGGRVGRGRVDGRACLGVRVRDELPGRPAGARPATATSRGTTAGSGARPPPRSTGPAADRCADSSSGSGHASVAIRYGARRSIRRGCPRSGGAWSGPCSRCRRSVRPATSPRSRPGRWWRPRWPAPPRPAGLPTTVTTLGTAASASLLSLLMLRAGRRPGVLAGHRGRGARRGGRPRRASWPARSRSSCSAAP